MLNGLAIGFEMLELSNPVAGVQVYAEPPAAKICAEEPLHKVVSGLLVTFISVTTICLQYDVCVGNPSSTVRLIL